MKLLLIFLLFVTSTGWAFDVPAFEPNVVDQAGILTAAEKKQLNDRIQQIRNGSHVFAAILIIQSLGSESIEAAANQVFKEWKLGQQGVDNGALIMIAFSERKSRIEVGYGIEGSLTDSRSKQILHEIVRPAFQQKRYFAGLDDALRAIDDIILHGDTIRLKPKNSARFSTDFFAGPIFLAGIFYWLAFTLLIPYLARTYLLKRARCFPDKLLPSEKEKAFVSRLLGMSPWATVIIFTLLSPFFLTSIIFFPNSWPFILFIKVFSLLIIIGTNDNYRSMRSEAARQNFLDKLISLATAQGHKVSENESIFDAAPTLGQSASGESSFDASTSPSSDGGSSGGGGASDGW